MAQRRRQKGQQFEETVQTFVIALFSTLSTSEYSVSGSYALGVSAICALTRDSGGTSPSSDHSGKEGDESGVRL